MRTGDVLELREQKPGKEWSLVMNAVTRGQGYVPSNFIACEKRVIGLYFPPLHRSCMSHSPLPSSLRRFVIGVLRVVLRKSLPLEGGCLTLFSCSFCVVVPKLFITRAFAHFPLLLCV